MCLSSTSIDNQLYKLLSVCNRNQSQFAIYVLYAVEYYINSARADTDFLKKFIALSETDLETMVCGCLKRNKLSDVEIIRYVEKAVRKM